MLSVVLAAVIVAIPSMWLPVVGILIPFLTAVVTRYRADSSTVHAMIAIVASGVVVVVQALVDDVPDTATSLGIAFLMVIGPAIGSYLGFWQPVVHVNERVLPDKGI